MALFNMFKPAEGSDSPTPVTTPNDPASTSPEGSTPEPEGLDKWGNLVQNGENPGDKPSAPTEVFDPVAILKDPEALEKISAGLDFSTSISSETQQKLSNNAPDAIISLVNDVGKAAYLQAIQHSSALSQQHVADIVAQQSTQTKGDIKSGLANYELEQALPEIKNPIVKLGIEQFVGKLKEQNPTISGVDVATEVRGYLKELSTIMNPSDSEKAGEQSRKDIDWLSEMGF